MRPVARGPWPTENDGAQKSFASDYKLAKADLLKRLGEFCSYCERRGDLHVEHVVPKNKDIKLKFDWSNFLLGCVNCNSIKSNKNASRKGFLWPDRDNTFIAFTYSEGGLVHVADGLPKAKAARTKKLYELVGLGRKVEFVKTASDLRWRKRRIAWDVATNTLIEWHAKKITVDTIRDLAVGYGFFSIWMTVFANELMIKSMLIASFPGTRSEFIK